VKSDRFERGSRLRCTLEPCRQRRKAAAIAAMPSREERRGGIEMLMPEWHDVEGHCSSARAVAPRPPYLVQEELS
jgi:hypothetical protein